MATHQGADTSAHLLFSLPATSRQRRLVLVATVLLIAVSGIAALFSATPLPQFPAAIPSLEAIICVCDLITSILLFAQYSIFPSKAILVLASGYLFTALIVVPHALTFPGAFAETGLLGASLQSTGWLYVFWHLGSPATVFAYACLKDADDPTRSKRHSGRAAIIVSLATVFFSVCFLTWIALVGDRVLPVMFVDRSNMVRSTLDVVIPSIVLVATSALVILWIRRRSVLDYGLMLMLCALISEQLIVAWLNAVRYTLGFYVGRLLSIFASIIVLTLLLEQTTRLYARLARSNTLLRREQDNKLMNLQAVVASISHEIKQPLSAITMNGSAARRYIEHDPPDLEEAQAALSALADDSHRAGRILDNMRRLFGKGERERERIDVNELALAALRLLRGELTDHGVTTAVELAGESPLVMGSSVQLQEVIVNLVHNAIDAMAGIKIGPRVLKVRTKLDGAKAVILEVEDSGPGIDPERLDGIFDAFVTTKAHGMGMGLAICRMIIERHGGQLTASSDGKSGALFQFILPIRARDKDAERMEMADEVASRP